ncbi:hypothetical protein ACVIN2_002917 [Bradyrhizobium sp. USDA 3650]
MTSLTDAAAASHPTAAPPIEQFWSSLRIAWKEGAVRQTDRTIAKPKRERRRPDPLVKATPQLREWFEAEPWRTSELVCKLQAEWPGLYRTRYSELFNVVSNRGAASKQAHCCFSSRENAAHTQVIDISPESPPLLDKGTAV